MDNMKLLMENWREFSDTASRELESRKRIYESYTTESRHVIYLFDGFGAVNEDTGHISPFKADFNVVLKEWEDGNLPDDIFFINAEKSFEHEMELFEEAFGSSKGKMKKAVAASEKEDSKGPEGSDKGTAKYKIREKLYAIAGATFGKAIVLANSVMKKVNGMVEKIVEWANDPKRNQKLAPKLINKLFSMAGGIAKAGKWMVGITKKLFKVYGHPYFRIGALIIAAIMVTIAMTSGIGFMAAAAGYPAWAAQRAVGPQIVKGVVTLGKLALTEEDNLGSDLLLEIFDLSEDILGTAADLLATANEDAGPSVNAFLSRYVRDASGAFVDGELVADKVTRIDVSALLKSNAALSDQHSALETLLNVTDGTSNMNVYTNAGAKVQQIIQSAVAAAKMMCESDPAACAGNARFLDEIEVLNHSVVQSTHMRFSAKKVVEKMGKTVSEYIDSTEDASAVTTAKDIVRDKGIEHTSAVTTAKDIVRGGEGSAGDTHKALKTAAKAGHAKAGGLEGAKALKTADTSGAGWKSRLTKGGKKIARLKGKLEELQTLDDAAIDRIVENIIKRIS